MKFYYRTYWIQPSLRGRWVRVYRPIIPITITGLTNAKRVRGLVDTGSDDTLLPRSLADDLGVETDESLEIKVTNISESPVAIVHGDVELNIQSGTESYSWSTQVGFIDYQDVENEMVILGHKGCLEFFQLFFDGPKKELEIKPGATFPGKRPMVS